MSVELSTIYKQIAAGKGKEYELLFSIVGLFSSVMEFDPVTDDPLPVTVDDVLYGLSSVNAEKCDWQNDRLQHIVSFVSTAVRNLIDLLHEKNLREHRITRPEQVREVDSRSMMWLAKKPGFTVKQKIASEQRMMGVYHTTSLDTAENRLFKVFMQNLEDVLLEKENACCKCGLSISEDFERFVSTVHQWLKSDEALLIGKWNNTPPNNTLLNDKNYRKIWKAHLMLRNLSDQVQYDLDHLESLKKSACFWLFVAKMNRYSDVRFQQRVLFPDSMSLSLMQGEIALAGYLKISSWRKIKYTLDDFCIPQISEVTQLFSFAEDKCNSVLPNKAFAVPEKFVNGNVKLTEVAAVDLSTVLPSYTFGNGSKGRFSQKLVHQSQCVKNVWYPCSSARSKLIYTKSEDYKTFSIHSIFNAELLPVSDSDDNKSCVEKACSRFAKTIKGELCCSKCLYVTSDDVDDFSPSVNAFKFSMNSTFTNTEILPRSIAILFTKLQDVQKNFRKDDEILVRMIYENYEIKSKIRVKYDKELAKENPETKGFVFQRLSVARENVKKKPLSKNVPQNMEHLLTMLDANLLKDSFSVDEFHFESKASFQKITAAKKEIVFYADEDSSVGAVEYDRLQKITPDIPLWLDVLPKLSMVDSTGKEYVLVEPEKVSIRPVVGRPVDIKISWKFSFPVGKEFYEFPLLQGMNKESSKYFAFIKDSSLPLERETKCRLKLTYTYGNPLPYNLEFIPISETAEFKSVSVKWENKSHKDYIHDMPVPNFVREYTWADMQAVQKRDSEEKSNLIDDWLPKEYSKIKCSGTFTLLRTLSRKATFPSQNVNESAFFFHINSLNCDAICYIDNRQHPQVGCKVWCCLKATHKGIQGIDPHVIGRNWNNTEFKKSLRFPAIMVWNNGRSIEDEVCPVAFREDTKNVLEKLKNILQGKELPTCVANEFMFFLSCMHKDIPDWFYPYLKMILDNVSNYFDYPKWIAYSLGDCSTEWQNDLLKQTILLLENPEKAEYAIRILAVALWRVNSFVFNLTSHDARVLIVAIQKQFDDMKKNEIKNRPKAAVSPKSKNQNKLNNNRLYSACLECLIALCRLRKKKNGEDADRNMLSALSPAANPYVKSIVENMKSIKCEIKTFLTFDIERSPDDHTPELLYAAHGYLSGLIDSNAIKVLEADFNE